MKVVCESEFGAHLQRFGVCIGNLTWML